MHHSSRIAVSELTPDCFQFVNVFNVRLDAGVVHVKKVFELFD
jgi:hypothetical protein